MKPRASSLIKISKISEPLARLIEEKIKKREREESQINTFRNERDEVTTYIQKYKGV